MDPQTLQVVATVALPGPSGFMAPDAAGTVFLASGRFGDTPAPSADHPSPHPNVVPDSFVILVAEPK